MALNVTLRELVTGEGSGGAQAQAALSEYASEMVGRFEGEPSVLLWGFGNELNLMADGCTYDKSQGAYFSTAEMRSFAATWAGWVKGLDPVRAVGTDYSHPRTRATALAASTVGCGGAACVSPDNPDGDYELDPSPYPKDSPEDYASSLAADSEGFDVVGIHAYGCYAPYDSFPWCGHEDDENQVAYVAVSVGVAQALGKPFVVGEFGSGGDGGTNVAGWESAAGDGSEAKFDFPVRGVLAAQASSDFALSNLWSFCSTKDSDSWCVDAEVDPLDAFITSALLNTTAAIMAGWWT